MPLVHGESDVPAHSVVVNLADEDETVAVEVGKTAHSGEDATAVVDRLVSSIVALCSS